MVRFGPVADGTGFYLLDKDFSHAFVVLAELAEAARQKLSEYPADRAADFLNIYAVQHVAYFRADGELTSFGPDPRAPAGRYLAERNALGLTGKAFSNGVPITRVEGVTDRQTLGLLADTLAYTKRVLGKDKLDAHWKRQTGANIGKVGRGVFNDQPGSVPMPAYPHDPEVAGCIAFCVQSSKQLSVRFHFKEAVAREDVQAIFCVVVCII